MGWLNFLENSFGTKDKNRMHDKGKKGKLRPGKFEVALKEAAIKNKSYTKDPLEYLEDRIEKSLEQDYKAGGSYPGQETDDNSQEFVFERLVRMKYVSRNLEAREKQVKSIQGWTRYLKSLPGEHGNMKFEYYVLRSILKYDLYWLDKNEDGSWKTGERSNNTKKEFPTFDPDITPGILSKMRGILLVLEQEPGNVEDMIEDLPEYHRGSPVYEAIKNADFRELYYLIKEEIELSRLKDEDIESVEGGEWLPVFSYKNCKNEIEREKVARALAKATEYSRDFCLKGLSTADEYLMAGDIYLYNVKTHLKAKGNRPRVVNIPEIAIHIYGGQIISDKEVHGNGENQSIKKEYLGIAKKFIEESDFSNKDEFVVRFLYQVYRPVRTFELNNGEKLTIDRFKLYRHPVKDYMEMYSVSLDEMAMDTKDISEKTKVFIGDLNLDNFVDLQNIEEITGRLTCSEKVMPQKITKLRKIAGIELTEEDKGQINFFIHGASIDIPRSKFKNKPMYVDSFPKYSDPRTDKVFY